jgi:rubrerythrin
MLGENPYKGKYLFCACCGATTFNKDYKGAFDTCPICGFNDEDLVTTDITLDEARAQFLKRKGSEQ